VPPDPGRGFLIYFIGSWYFAIVCPQILAGVNNYQLISRYCVPPDPGRGCFSFIVFISSTHHHHRFAMTRTWSRYNETDRNYRNCIVFDHFKLNLLIFVCTPIKYRLTIFCFFSLPLIYFQCAISKLNSLFTFIVYNLKVNKNIFLTVIVFWGIRSSLGAYIDKLFFKAVWLCSPLA